jgi:signal transduction histidine kinase
MQALGRPIGASSTQWRFAERLPRRRRRAAWALALGGPLLIAAVARELGSSIPPATTLFVTLLVVIFVALIGGARASTTAIAVALVSQEVLFSFPYGSLKDRHPAQISVLLVFVIIGLGIGVLVDELALITTEQAALRRIATLVALGKPPPELLSAVAGEVVALLGADGALVAHLEPDGLATLLAVRGQANEFVVGERLRVDPATALGKVVQTGHPARTDDYRDASDEMRQRIHKLGIRSSIATPIIVEGRLWGVIVASSRHSRLALHSERRMLHFTDLLATAIANAESSSQLAASRARIVAASDATRRRVERDLHDGVQQRLVSLALDVRAAQSALPTADGVRDELARVVDGLTEALEEVREIARGIHPAILSEGGLEPALKTLARRAPVAMTVDVRIEDEIPDGVAVAAYYSISELVTNTAKHARATGFDVAVGTEDACLRIVARDDGIGGADPSRGSGLVGLRDRVEALGGTIAVRSPSGNGTVVEVSLPLDAPARSSG